MSQVKQLRNITIVPGGATVDLSISDGYDEYQITGGAGANLTAGYTIRQALADPTPEGLTYIIKYGANVAYAGLGNVITIFGRQLTTLEAIQELWITAKYTTGAWVVDILYDMNNAVINLANIGSDIYADDTTVQTGTNNTKFFTSLKLANWWANLKGLTQTLAGAITMSSTLTLTAQTAKKFLTVNASKVVTGVDLVEVITKDVSFETGEQCDNGIYIPYACTLASVRGYVRKAIAASDAGTITMKINSTAVTSGVLTFPLSSALDTEITATPSALNVLAAGDILKCTSAKSTAGGKVGLVIILTRILS